jgi:hypothetical protein
MGEIKTYNFLARKLEGKGLHERFRLRRKNNINTEVKNCLWGCGIDPSGPYPVTGP